MNLKTCGVFLGMCALAAGGCGTTPKAPSGAAVATSPAAPRNDLNALVECMTGSFSSAQQHAADPENFLDIRLHMTPIWTHRLDGRWIYVEQATADAQAKPYRQRVYRVTANTDDSFESAVFTLKGDPLRVAGWWRTPALFAGLTPADLEPRTGCSLILHADDRGWFVGETNGRDCPSERGGAAYATSQATIRPDGMTTWDRGYDAAGAQVWGATKGGYEFRKSAD